MKTVRLTNAEGATPVPPEPELVRWGPVDGKPPGIALEGDRQQTFLPWRRLKPEVEKMLLPQVRRVPIDSSVAVHDLGKRKAWIVNVLGPDSREVGSLWFGTDPDANWRWDGLVRLGDSQRRFAAESVVWQIFQRYSDGSYRRVHAAVITDKQGSRKTGFV